MMVTCHSNTLLSSTSPAENPSTGFFARSATIPQKGGPRSRTDRRRIGTKKKKKGIRRDKIARGAVPIRTFELLLEQEARLARGSRHGKQSSIGSELGFWRLGGGGSPPFLGTSFICGGVESSQVQGMWSGR